MASFVISNKAEGNVPERDPYHKKEEERVDK